MIDAPLVAAMHARLSAALARPTEPYVPLCIGDVAVGWLDPARATRLARFDGVFTRSSDRLSFAGGLRSAEARTDALGEVVRTLAAEGELSPWRDEPYAVATTWRAQTLCEVERAAARYLGIMTYAAHLNAVVEHEDGVYMWIARRSPTKAIDPGQLDNLVGGGIRAGHSVLDTLVREAWEEAGMLDGLARRAVLAGIVRICRVQPQGLQREIIFVHDLAVPADFIPSCVDGEAVGHRLVPLVDAARLVAQDSGSDLMTADASLVALDCLVRRGVLSSESPHYVPLLALRWPQMEPVELA